MQMIREEIDKRFKALYDAQKSVAESVGTRMDVIADTLTVSCNDILAEPATSLEQISIPWHHYEALTKLYKQRRTEYNKLLKAAQKFQALKRKEASFDYRKHLEETCR